MKYLGKTYEITVPKTRDPFVNTGLINAGIDTDTGFERFWTTTYNGNVGCTGALVDEWGNSRIVMFGVPYYGFYSAVYLPDNKLWMCGFMDKVCCYDINNDKLDAYETDAPGTLVFQGMPYDPVTGRLFIASSNPPIAEGIIFDTRLKKTVTVFKDAWPHKYMHNSFNNGDGTFTVILTTPGTGYYNWDPTTCKLVLKHDFPIHDQAAGAASSHLTDNNMFYVPYKGWFNPVENCFIEGIKPEEEAVWLKYDKENNTVYGGINDAVSCTIVKWDTLTGKVTKLYTVQYANTQLLAFTKDNTAIVLNKYGYFYRIDLKNKCLETCKRLETDEYGRTDCLRRINEKTLLGTPFITQRFWTVDLETGKGTDCGRVVSSGGQVNLTWKIDNKIYMAAYTSGELAKYDPELPVFFPENPYVVVNPPKPAMRPVGGADDGESLYYTCDNEYGLQGCMIVKYNTKTNRSMYTKDVLPGQQIRSLFYDREKKVLVGGSTPEGDCGSYIPSVYESYFSLIDPETLKVIKTIKAAEGTKQAHVAGLLGNGKALIRHADKNANVWNYENNTYESLELPNLGNRKINGFVPTVKPGYFVVHVDTDLELWDLPNYKKVSVIAQDVTPARLVVDNEHIYLHSGNNITVLDYALKGLI